GLPASRKGAAGVLGGRPVRVLAVVADTAGRFARARQGEVGLLDGWGVAKAVYDDIEDVRDRAAKRALIAIVDVHSQAYV
ncbi:biotin-independent malonate decarboxylase subunit gamma, partial [Pseudomonas syringae pv. tagetis]